MALRNLGVVVLVAALSIGAALGLSRLGRSHAPLGPLELAPGGSSIVLDVEVPALLGSPLWEALVGEDPDLGRLEEACGFDPLARLSRASLYVVGTTRHPLDQVGFLVRGDLPQEDLVRCVEHAVASDGGEVHAVELEGEPALALDGSESRAAFLDPDGAVLGDEVLVRQVLRIQHGSARGASDDEVLRRLWSRVEGRRELVLAMHVPAAWRRTLTRLTESRADLSALGALESVGLGARIRRGLGATLVLVLETDADARALAEGLRAQLDGWRADRLVRLSTLGGALRHVDLEAEGNELVVTFDLDEDELEAVVAVAREALDRLLADDEPPPIDRPPEPPLELPAPDLVIAPSATP